MEVVIRSTMPDGTKIQIENWKRDFPGVFTTYTLAAYPKSKVDHNFIRKNESFRLDMCREFQSDDEVRDTYEKLKRGEITLESLDKHYYNGDRDRYYMGLVDAWDRP